MTAVLMALPSEGTVGICPPATDGSRLRQRPERTGFFSNALLLRLHAEHDRSAMPPSTGRPRSGASSSSPPPTAATASSSRSSVATATAPALPSPLFLLPRPFGLYDLLYKDHPLLLKPHDNKICLPDEDVEAKAIDGEGIGNGIEGDLDGGGGEGVAHARWTNLGPMQVTVAANVAAVDGSRGAGEAYEFMATAVVEAEGLAMSHKATTKIFLVVVVASRAHLKFY
uniref:Uncharacterized protein LOC114914704 n=1 Tax=Elaeis guineensis var. tenera TaxID=51953 RepID=A0A8N4IGM3_ELAGV|nr:uncharacterized protein LOC114914704 [Elaeis guineensis]